jgi:hypothetical protein
MKISMNLTFAALALGLIAGPCRADETTSGASTFQCPESISEYVPYEINVDQIRHCMGKPVRILKLKYGRMEYDYETPDGIAVHFLIENNGKLKDVAANFTY